MLASLVRLTSRLKLNRLPLAHRFFVRLYRLMQPRWPQTVDIPLGRLTYYPKDLGVGFYLQNFGQFEPTTSQIFLDQLKRGKVIIDIGANIGYYTVLAAKKVGQSGHVIAIEPEIHNLKQLQKNLQLNQLKNVQVVKQPLSDRSQKTRLYLASTSGEHSLIHRSDHSIPITTVTLDQLVSRLKIKPHLIKIDTEGSESQILSGGQQTLQKFHPTLIFELSTSDKKTFDQLARLTQTGYRLSHINEKQKRVQSISIPQIKSLLQQDSFINLLAQYGQKN